MVKEVFGLPGLSIRSAYRQKQPVYEHKAAAGIVTAHEMAVTGLELRKVRTKVACDGGMESKFATIMPAEMSGHANKILRDDFQ